MDPGAKIYLLDSDRSFSAIENCSTEDQQVASWIIV